MRKAHLVLPCFFGLLIGSCFQVHAQVGTCSGCLDATFGAGGNGLVVNASGTSVSGIALETVTQNGVPVQKIVVDGGGFQPNGSPISVVLRYNLDGTLDTSFNGSGVASLSGLVYGMAVQSDGKIVVAVDLPGNAAGVERLNTDGSLDASFGSGGIVSLTPSSSKNFVSAHGIVVQSDGNIVLVGNVVGTATVWRFTTSGKLDTTFGSGGSAAISVGSPRAVAMQNVTVNGSAQPMIVIAGFSTVTLKGKSHDELAVTRLTSSGRTDTSFGSAGLVAKDFGFSSLFMGLAIDSTNRIVAAGYASPGSGDEAVVAHYNVDGSVDSGFGTNGYSFVTTLSKTQGWALALQADGKTLVGGTSWTSTGNPEMSVARLTTTGAPDGNFGSGGYSWADFSALGYPKGYGYGVLMQPDGKIVLAGSPAAGTGSGPIGLARYWP